MRVAIVGSREKFLAEPMAVRHRVRDYVADLPRDTIIISGGARGVDSYAARAARMYNLVLVEYAADWDTYGKRAGHIRNQLVLDQAERVVVFWDGASPGTGGMIRKVRASGKPLEVYTVARRVLS